MSSIDERYPSSCPFCTISTSYPPSSSSPIPSNPDPEKISPQCHLFLSTPHVLGFLDIMPMAVGHILLTTRHHYTKLSDLQPPPSRRGLWPTSSTSPSSPTETARALGEWLPIVSRALCAVTGVEDWNVVQNNGPRAAQVVPHIHFHLIPRYQEHRRDEIEGRDLYGRRGKRGGKQVDVQNFKSWKMFGKGTREDLDDDEAKVLARQLRDALRKEMEGESGGGGEKEEKAKL